VPVPIDPLHIAIDVRRVRDFGIGTYIRNLTHALSRRDPDNRYTLVARPEDVDAFAGLGANFRVAPVAAPDNGVKYNLQFPSYFKSLKASLYHIPLNTVPWRMPRPYVVTIHDMSTLMFPPRKDLRYTLHQERYRRGARHHGLERNPPGYRVGLARPRRADLDHLQRPRSGFHPHGG